MADLGFVAATCPVTVSPDMSIRLRCAVIGGGWAGLSAAWELARLGHDVTVFEAAPRSGGRARTIETRLAGRHAVLDNGQHLLIGAYSGCLALIAAAHHGIDVASKVNRCDGRSAAQADPPAAVSDDSSSLHRHRPVTPSRDAPGGLVRLPLQFDSARLALRQRGPGRLGLMIGFLTARGLSGYSRWRMLVLNLRLAIAGWRGFDGLTVSELMSRFGQTAQANERFWTPLCIAAMNTQPDRACAQTFVNVLHDSMIASADGSDFLVPVQDLGHLMPEPMVDTLRSMGETVKLGEAVRAITARGKRWTVSTTRSGRDETALTFDQLVLATPSWQTARLLEPIVPEAAVILDDFEQEAIQTVFLAWAQADVMNLPTMRMLDEDAAIGHYGQWFFARAPQQELQIGAVVISVRAGLSGISNDELTRSVTRQVCLTLGLPAPLDAIAVNEKRATFRCTPQRPRIAAGHIAGQPLPLGMALAGDYCLARYPGTLEAAVRSGTAAATYLQQSRHR